MMSSSEDSTRSYIDSPEKLKKLYKKVLIVVSISQIFGGAGLAAGITVGALLAQQMLGTDSYAGVPSALFTLGSAGAALIIGRLSQRFGRRTGLATGFIVGGLGAIGVVVAAIVNSIILLFASLLIYGAGTATNLQARYAGTDLANEKQRATAISVTMVMTTFGAVAGPNLVNVMGKFATFISVPSLAGPFILSATAFILAGIVLFIMLRPDPLDIANRIAAYKEQNGHDNDSYMVNQKNNKRGLAVGATVMVLTQIVMVAIMTMTPVHMKHHGHGLGEVGIVIGFHIGSMYLPSLVTGVLVDKIGRTAMSIVSGITLLLAGLLAALAPSDSMVLLVIALSLLGLGWNFGLISGTAQIVDSTEPSSRAKVQGTLDVFIALAGASGGVLSGMVMASTSYAVLSLVGGLLSLVLIPVVIWSTRNKDIIKG
ncbi:MFS transporter [Bacillus atrophaeus]|uniref:Major facilitator transporter n=2 Tax=Bacillus atrophaeus TaxID=1452 RepID=A0ABN3ZF28_BACA1|nr:MFS transporter [Bacillus atrophaeus]AMR64518.1 MFS transporter [Bacillus subtilis subsp. globigii]ADP34605.1 major facilitator transporter [Bacillus atrophaeus 1942]AIK46199.1 major Facilitator Superfamily protein [Bacillus atrophaeus subsp. globigii]EIM11583.1 major facilitator transporter [Bacillus atrophaeus C89]KFK82670.1 major Facilitator Superfamily protein [Bacillus atrophaeus]